MKFQIKYLGIVLVLLLVISGCNKISNENDSVTGGSVIDTNKDDDKVEEKPVNEEDNTIQDERIIVNLNKFEYLLENGEGRNIDGRIIFAKEINDNNVVLEIDGENIRLPLHELRTIRGVDVDLRIIKIIDENNFVLEFKKSQTVGKKYRYVFNVKDKINFDGKIITVDLRGTDRAVLDVNGKKATFVLDNSKELNDLEIEVYDIVNEDGIDYDYVYMLVKDAEPIDDRNNN
ncbi:hypothetical protein J4455_02325 [Candidatus Woesearchaeota archaeon]|nr:hypothetical protein [Candidatus Woesearchaeota archaeon]